MLNVLLYVLQMWFNKDNTDVQGAERTLQEQKW